MKGLLALLLLLLSGPALAQGYGTTYPQSITPVASPAIESGRVWKAGDATAVRLAVTTGASAGFFMVFNATSIPADGAVAPVICRAVSATSSLSLTLAEMPARFPTGLVVVFSTGANCVTKAASATAFFEASFF